MRYTLSRRNFTQSQQDLMWHYWSEGKSLSEIGRRVNKHAGSVFCFLNPRIERCLGHP